MGRPIIDIPNNHIKTTYIKLVTIELMKEAQ